MRFFVFLQKVRLSEGWEIMVPLAKIRGQTRVRQGVGFRSVFSIMGLHVGLVTSS